MGCAASTLHSTETEGISPPDADSLATFNKGRRLSEASHNTRLSRASTKSDNRTSAGEASRSTRRRSSQNIFRRFSHGSTISSTDYEKQEKEDLDLGSDSKVAKAPSQWLAVMGPKGSGKSTLIRQLRVAHEGTDLAEAQRFAREARKVALNLVKQAAAEVAPMLKDADAKAAADRLQALGRRAQLGHEIAADVRALWQSPEISKYEQALTDVQRRKACRHYVERIETLADAEYVPEQLDLLHMAVPTVGQTDTRVPSFPGGELTLIELNADVSRSSMIIAEAVNNSTPTSKTPNPEENLFGPGLRGIVFVASLLDYEEVQWKTDGAPVALSADVLKMWHHAQSLATSARVPCFLLLTKRDLVGELNGKLPGGLSPASFETMFRRCLLSHQLPGAPQQTSPQEASRNTQAVAVTVKSGASTECTAALDVLDMDGGITPVVELVVKESFPELDFEDGSISNSLGDSVHVCLSLFSDQEGAILSKGGVLPVVKWQSSVLTFADHVWLHELPQPLPNPLKAGADDASLMGKGSSNETRALFWRAICSLVEQACLADADTIGTMHVAPLLTSSGALMIVFRRAFTATPSLGTLKRGIKWRPSAQVAWKLSKVAQAGELRKYSQGSSRTSSSYSENVKEMLASTPSKEMHPSMWLEKLRVACKGDAPKMLSPGTYMVAFYTLSTLDGLQILMPTNEHPSMPPYVKISDGVLTSNEWAQLCELGMATKAGKMASVVPKNWGAAKSWMGPYVGNEKQFSMIQKFFYGVVCLRQRLERKCTAVKDELRYSALSGASESLATLGELYTNEIVLPDPEGRVQMIFVAQHFDVSSTDTFPKSMRWMPFSLFEAQHFKRFVPSVHHAYCTSKNVLFKALENQRTLEGRMRRLRSSAAPSDAGSEGLRDSNHVSMTSDLGNELSAHDPMRLSKLMGNASLVESFFCVDDEKAIDDIWNSLRWTKRVMHATVMRDDKILHASEHMTKGERDHHNHKSQPKQRVQQHVKECQAAVKGMAANIVRMKQRATQVEALLRENSSGEVAGAPAPAA